MLQVQVSTSAPQQRTARARVRSQRQPAQAPGAGTRALRCLPRTCGRKKADVRQTVVAAGAGRQRDRGGAFGQLRYEARGRREGASKAGDAKRQRQPRTMTRAGEAYAGNERRWA
jgi:hypothetical protein